MRRKPRPRPSSPSEGQRTLKAELDHLWRELRPEVVKALAAAAAEGDRSENAEYTYRKKQLGEIDRRVRYLSKRLPTMRVSTQAPTDREAVYFGAWIRIADETGKQQCLRIVGPDETDAASGCISIDSPLARALLRKRAGDEIDASLPAGRHSYAIIAISYDGQC